MLSFRDTSITYSGVTTLQLRKQLLLFRAASNKHSIRLMKNFFLLLNLFHIPYTWLLKKSIHQEFWGGNTIEQCINTTNRLWDKGFYTTINDSLLEPENPYTEEYFDFVVDFLGRTTVNPKIAFFTLNVKYLIEPRILKIISEKKLLNQLDKEKFDRFVEQVSQICKLGYKHDKPIIIEPTFHFAQDIINSISTQMMMEFNKERAVVYSSLYLCRMDSLRFITELNQKAIKNGFIAGIKLTKGDQYEIERETMSNKEDKMITYAQSSEIQRSFCDAIKYCITNINSIWLIVGSHTEENIIYTLSLMANRFIGRKDGRIFFVQLQGLGNNISLNLTKAGYNVLKIVQLGLAKHALPYIFTKVENNPEILKRANDEIELIRAEIDRRRQAKYSRSNS